MQPSYLSQVLGIRVLGELWTKVRLLAQERSTTTEAQLAETTSQLHNLKLKQKELEARNALLEKLARLDKQHKLQQEPPTNGCNVLLWQVIPWPIAL
jgi:hypothetical protein